MISYKPLFKLLIDRDMKKNELQKLVGCSHTTLWKMRNNEYIALEVIDRICTALNCKIEDVIEIIPSDK